MITLIENVIAAVFVSGFIYILIGVVVSLTGADIDLEAQGNDYTALMIICFIVSYIIVIAFRTGMKNKDG